MTSVHIQTDMYCQSSFCDIQVEDLPANLAKSLQAQNVLCAPDLWQIIAMHNGVDHCHLPVLLK